MDLIHVNLWKKSNQTFPELLPADLTRAEGITYLPQPNKTIRKLQNNHKSDQH